MAGRFITFEGIDGSGKSSAIAAVAKALQEDGTALWRTREETDTPLGEAVRESIRSYADPLTTTFLFLADRAQHATEIRKHLAQGHVLCDRFLHSTLAYQSVTLADRMPDPSVFLERLHDPIGLEPDHVVLLDLPAATAVDRVLARGASTPYEKVAFLEKVRAAYLDLARRDASRFTVIDASQDQAAVAQQCIDVVRKVL